MQKRRRSWWQDLMARRTKSEWITLGVVAGVVAVLLLATTFMTPYQSSNESASTFYLQHETSKSIEYLRAEVMAGGTIKLLDGTRQGQVVALRNPTTTQPAQGSTVLVYETDDAGSSFHFREHWRIPSLIAAAAIFLLLVVLVAGRQGAMSITGLALSLMIIIWGIIPLIVHGWPAFWVCLAGALLIGSVSILVAHGLRRRTFISLGVIGGIILGIALLSWVVINLLHLSGLADEVAYVLADDLPRLDMRGVLAGGIIIAALGVLDDIVTTQVAAVEELSKANPAWSFEKLYAAARSIGREHIASLVNTLALAYAGAALPFILLVSYSSALSPLLTLNSEYIATEVARTLVASAGLVVAVPLSTAVAIWLLHRK